MTAVAGNVTTADGAAASGTTRTISAKHMRWLTEERRIDAETVARFGLYTAKWDAVAKVDIPDPRGNILVFPFRDGGRVVNDKFRAPNKVFWQRTGGFKTFWNAEVMDDPVLETGAVALIIAEGELDALTAIDVGFPFAVSVPDGAPPAIEEARGRPSNEDAAAEKTGKFEFMWNNRDRLKRIKRFLIATDGDPPGQRLASELVRRLGAGRCWFVTYPDGCKDLNDVLMKHGAEAVVKTINGARPYPVKGVYRLSEYPDLPEPETFSTGWVGLDHHLRLWPGELMVVTGIPSHGKSTWMLATLSNLVNTYGWSVGVASFEMPTVPYLRGKLRRLRLGTNEWTPLERSEADRWIEQNWVFFDFDPAGDDEDIDLEWVIDRATDAVLRYGIRVLLIDPWNELEHAKRRDETETQYVGRALRSLKRFARQYEVVVIVVAHPTKEVGKDGKGRRPTLYDIEGSANWYNKPDHGVIIDCPNAEHKETIVCVRKVRFESTGRKGDYTLIFDPGSGRFTDPGADYGPLWKVAERAGKDAA